MENVIAICSMLHEPPAQNPDAPISSEPLRLNSATRIFRGEPVLSWTLDRLTRSQRLTNIALLCWEDQLPPIEDVAAEYHAYVLAKGPRQNLASVEAIAAARRWTDGWRGGLLSTADCDLGFYAPWIKELAERMKSDAIVLIDPSAGLVDPAIIDQLVKRAGDKENVELFFTQAPPGLGAVLLRPALLDRLCEQRAHPGRLLHYMPEAPTRDPIGSDACVAVPTPVARSTRSFRLDSHRQVARLSDASRSLNGTLISSGSEMIVHRLHWSDALDELPREIVIELNSLRQSVPIWWPGKMLVTPRSPGVTLDQWTKIFNEAAGADDLRISIGAAGFGDPLESELLLPLIAAAKSAGVSSVHVQTDLLCTDTHRLDQLAASETDIVSVNIPALGEATYLAVMGIDGLKRAMENVSRFVQARNARGRGVPLLVPVFTKCATNLAEMEAWYDRWLAAVGCAVIDGPGDFAGQIESTTLADMSPPRRSACARINNRMTILCDGTVVACEQDVLGKNPIGKIGEQSLREIWTKRLDPLRADHAAGKWDSHSLCAGCKEWHRP